MEDREPDIHNFSTSPSQHRLPTVSGAEALRNASIKARGIPTSLPGLDAILLPGNLPFATSGIQRGHVTEVFGPPGVGKSTFGLQLAVNAIHSRDEDGRVLWVSTGSPLVEERLDEICAAHQSALDHDSPSSLPESGHLGSILDDRFECLEATVLARLMTLFLHPTHDFPAPDTSLIVIDDLSKLVLGSFSRDAKNIKPNAPPAVQEKLAKKAAGKRMQIIENLATAMSKLAAMRNVAVVVLTNATTSMKGGQGAFLTPALASHAWESAVHTRIMLYRDFPPEDLKSELLEQAEGRLRYGDVQKLARKEVYTRPVPFTITSGGLHELHLPHIANDDSMISEHNGIPDLPSDPDLPPLPLEIGLPERHAKRKLDEIADSEDEEGDNDDNDNAHPSSRHRLPDNKPFEPELPSPPGNDATEISSDDTDTDEDAEREEMILDTHETSVLRRYRHAIIKGSEDAEPLPSSDAEDEVGDSEDETIQDLHP